VTNAPNDFNNTIRYTPPTTQYVPLSQQAPTTQHAPTSQYAPPRQYVPTAQYVPGAQYTPTTQYTPTSQYDPVSSISDQLANATLSPAASLRDNRHVSANNPKEQTERLDPRKSIDLNCQSFIVTDVDRISCY
jgi:hypothetical protein